MKIVHVTESSATTAPLRISEAVERSGAESVVLVHDAVRGFGSRARVAARPGFIERRLDVLRHDRQRKLLAGYPERDPVLFSPGLSGIDISRDPEVMSSDIVNLHWVCMGYLRPESIAKLLDSGKKVVWTMHDLWPVSGGCHYGCDRFEDKCGACPVLHSDDVNDNSATLIGKKVRLWKGRGIVTVSPSRWLQSGADRSAVFSGGRNEYIPNPIDTEVFGMKDETETVSGKDGLFRVLFGASDTSSPYKGFEYFEKLLMMISERAPGIAERLQVVTFGRGEPDSAAIGRFRHEAAGFLDTEEKMAALYRSADILVAPSLEDNFPGTVLESMASGTPVLGFDTGGIPDMVDSGINGFIAGKGDAEGLYTGFKWLYENRQGNGAGIAARRKVLENYTMEKVGQRYMDLYNDIMGGRETAK
ncbi:MAG: glycosyltransferase [Lachnospiraceae bacterium]|nr:glycosyltransferase [Lachnospiraceae bacterium]